MIYIDIETYPNNDLIAGMDPARWADYMTRKKMEKPEHACFYPEVGKVACVSIDDPEEGMLSACGADEVRILETVGAWLDHPRKILCGHNIKGFDLPFLANRYLANRMPIPGALRVAGKKPWEISHVDTMELIKFGGGKAMALGDLAVMLGLDDPKVGGENKHMHELVAAGEWERIQTYCEGDVTTTRKIHKILQRLGAA